MGKQIKKLEKKRDQAISENAKALYNDIIQRMKRCDELLNGNNHKKY